MNLRAPLALLIGAVLTSPAIAGASVIRLSEPVNVTEAYEEFGAELPAFEQVHTLSEAVGALPGLDGELVVIETEIQQVCQKKGCFFMARDGETVARVRFKDYGFFIPTDSAGKTVTLAGTVSRIELSPEQAAHFADDLGEAAPDPTMAQFEYQIMATAVRIPRA